MLPTDVKRNHPDGLVPCQCVQCGKVYLTPLNPKKILCKVCTDKNKLK